LSEEIVDRIDADYQEADLDPRHKAVIAWTDAMLSAPARVPEAVKREMHVHFSPAEIVELSTGVALFMGFSKIAIALGQVPDRMPTTVVPTPDLPESTS
jgi:alkylhydroperoxidase family enzyme